VHHKISAFLPNENCKPHFSQIYIYDAANQYSIRSSMYPNVIKTEILNMLQNFLQLNNPYVQIYMQAGETLRNDKSLPFNIVIKADVRNDRTKNKPTCNEIAVLMVEDDQQNINKRDIVLHRKNGDQDKQFQFINENVHYYDPLAYPLLHLYGESGWQFNKYKKRNKETLSKLDEATQTSNQSKDDFINHELNDDNLLDDENGNSNKFVTSREFYAYRLQDRPGTIFYFI
jgi:hypothetical protein